MCVHWWSDRVLEAIDRAKRKAWPAGAEDHWCDHHVQTVEAAGLKKTRHGIRAAFDQYASQAEFGEPGKDCTRRDISVCRG